MIPGHVLSLAYTLATYVKAEEGRKGRMQRPAWLVLCAVVAIVLLGGTVFAAPLRNGPQEKKRKIVVFQTGTQEAARYAAVQQHEGKVRHTVSLVDGFAVDMPEPAVQSLQHHPQVKAIYDDLHVRTSSVISFTPVPPPDAEGYDWGQQHIGVPATRAWLDKLGRQLWRVRVAILDTGLDLTHPELRQLIVGGYNALSGEDPSNYQDDNGHGTHMAGIIAAVMNGQGIVGAASHARLSAVKVLDSTGHGYLSDLLNGLAWVLENNIQVVNMSLSLDEGSPLLEQAIHDLNEAGVIIVASAGNTCKVGVTATDSGGDDSGGDNAQCTITQDPLQGGVKYPARYPAAIAVGSTDINDNIASYSRTGRVLDLVAPGGSSVTGKILSTITGSQYAYGSGTSQATAHVTGAVAVVLQLAPGLSSDHVLKLLKTTATHLVDPNGVDYTPAQQGAGLINVERMVQTLLDQ